MYLTTVIEGQFFGNYSEIFYISDNIANRSFF